MKSRRSPRARSALRSAAATTSTCLLLLASSTHQLAAVAFGGGAAASASSPAAGRRVAVGSVPRGGALSLGASSGGGDDAGDDGSIEGNAGGRGNTNNRRRRLIQGALGTIAALPVAAEAYSRRAYDLRSDHGVKSGSDLEAPERGWESVEHATVVFHGAGGQDGYTDELMAALRKQSSSQSGDAGGSNTNNYDVMIDWSESSSNLLQASFNGQRVGRKVGSSLLARAPNLKSVHAVGISVGAFAADACVSEMKAQIAASASDSGAARRRSDGKAGDGDVYAQLTLLDPFLQRGAVDPAYGRKNFGRTADYAQQFYNTDDPVPATGKPCPNCVCTDLTSLRPAEIFGHDWPLVHYARSGKVGLVAKDDRHRIGSIFVATASD